MCNFGSNRSKNKENVLGEHNTFSAVSQLPLNGFSWNSFILCATHKHGYDRSTKYLSAVSPLRMHGFPSKSTPRKFRACATNGASLRSV